MGLPDFHTSEPGYQSIDRRDTGYMVTGIAEEIFFNYGGFGEIINMVISISQVGAYLHLLDKYSVYIDGSLVFERNLNDLLVAATTPNTSLFHCFLLYPTIQVKFSVLVGLKFNASISLRIDKQNTGNMYVNTEALFGLY